MDQDQIRVLKLGGELLEQADRREAICAAIARIAARTPIVVIHGGGRDIDAALAKSGIAKHQVDGLRVTDSATLDVVVSVLAGIVNTRLVAGLVTAGAQAVGLTGADAAIGLSERAAPHRTKDGRVVALGEVGHPVADAPRQLLLDLLDRGYVPVIASIGLARTGAVLNVNADTLAAHVAARLGAARLVIAGATAGVLDDEGCTIPALDEEAMTALVNRGTASAGMLAKLAACRSAIAGGVGSVTILDGREIAALETALLGHTQEALPTATRIARAGRLTAVPQT